MSSIYDTAEIDLDYMGPHDPLIEILPEFTKGELIRGSLKKRPSYRQTNAGPDAKQVIDMSKVRMDFARNDVSDRTF